MGLNNQLGGKDKKNKQKKKKKDEICIFLSFLQ